MTFRIPCPDCGPRDVEEFSFGGETAKRPGPEGSLTELARYLFFRTNVTGEQTEWWYHRNGCERWLLAVRDTRSNAVLETRRPSVPAEGGP
jgi:methylglutamate dehydrogenase subunit B